MKPGRPQWRHLCPGETLDDFVERLRGQAQRGGVPTAFVALKGDRPVGSASLVVHDMQVQEDLSPWLASVYGAPGGGFILRTTGGEAGTWPGVNLDRVLANAERMIEAGVRYGQYPLNV